MKRQVLIIVVTIGSLLLGSTTQLMAQEPAQSTDEKINNAVKKRDELRRQILDELEKQNKNLEAELDRLRQSNGTTLASTAGPMSPPKPGSGTSEPPVNESAATGNGNSGSGNNPAAVNTPAPPGNTTAATPPATPAAATDSCVLIRSLPANYSRADRDLCALANVIVKRRQVRPDSGIDTRREDLQYLVTVVLAERIKASLPVDPSVKALVVDVESARNDKQLGSDPKSAGTTSLGVKGGIPQVFSWAVENGAAVASRNGTTLTFRVNPIGFVQGLSNQGYITGFTKTENDPLAKFLRRTSVGFSFDTTRGTDPPTFIGSKQQLSAISFRYQFVNQRDPRAERYRKLWDEFFQNEALAFTNTQTEQYARLQDNTIEGALNNAALQNWVIATNVALKQAKTSPTAVDDAIEEVRGIIRQQLEKLPVSELDKDLDLTDAMSRLIGAYGPYLKKRKEIMDEVLKGAMVTFEYTNYREPNAPDLSNFRFIAEKGMLGGVDFTANASLTLYNKRPAGPNIQRVRDFDFSGQLEKRINDAMGLGPAFLSFAGKYQRLTSNAVAFDGTVLPNTKGDIAAAQVKFTIPIKDSGIKIPFSVTFANRTELIREREVRGNFGFTFDLDTLFARFKAFSGNLPQ